VGKLSQRTIFSFQRIRQVKIIGILFVRNAVIRKEVDSYGWTAFLQEVRKDYE
jgi:hypothetical protein